MRRERIALAAYDQPTRKRAYAKIQHAIVDELPFLTMWFWRRFDVVSDDLKGYKPPTPSRRSGTPGSTRSRPRLFHDPCETSLRSLPYDTGKGNVKMNRSWKFRYHSGRGRARAERRRVRGAHGVLYSGASERRVRPLGQLRRKLARAVCISDQHRARKPRCEQSRRDRHRGSDVARHSSATGSSIVPNAQSRIALPLSVTKGVAPPRRSMRAAGFAAAISVATATRLNGTTSTGVANAPSFATSFSGVTMTTKLRAPVRPPSHGTARRRRPS